MGKHGLCIHTWRYHGPNTNVVLDHTSLPQLSKALLFMLFGLSINCGRPEDVFCTLMVAILSASSPEYSNCR